MRILAIETSCDETAIAVLLARRSLGKGGEVKFNILSNMVSSQVKLHAKWGGVVPSLAKREHLKNLPVVLNKALKKANLLESRIKNYGLRIPNIDLIAVVNGPGLEPALWTGINFAKNLAKEWKKPLIPTNHLEGHLFSVFLKAEKNSKLKTLNSNQVQSSELQIPKIEFPAIALLVSGGHTQLILVKGWLKYKVIGETRDDAAGEAFDKVARMLNLGYPGGPAISKSASQFDGGSTSIKLPRPMINSKDYDFSFSGLKTAVLYKTKEFKRLTPKIKIEICAEFQQAVIDVLISKTLKATKEHKAKTIIVAGGVSANKELRKQFKSAIAKKIPGSCFMLPDSRFTGDNALMIALAAYFRWKSASAKATARQSKKPASLQALKAQGNLKLS